MLRLPIFDVATPTTVAEVVEALGEGARIVAGGTDLLPNLKHRMERPQRLVSLARVDALRAVDADGEALRLGAGVTLKTLSDDPRVREHFPSLAKAASLVAGPQLRAMGTLGGNLNLDTRCRYVNQTEFWRSAIGGCLKSDGDVCHVVPKGRRCVAAMSSDCVPALISLDATVELVGPDGARSIPLADYYHADGLSHTRRGTSELMTQVRVPLPTSPRRTEYVKWRVRKSIDFPLVSVALRFDLSSDGSERIEGVRVVVGVLAARPKEVTGLEAAVGRSSSDPALADLIAERTFEVSKPLENVPYEASYRRTLIRTLTRRAVVRLMSHEA